MRSTDLFCLHPDLRYRVEDLQTLLDKVDLPLEVFEGYRSWRAQAERYASGRTKSGKIITKAKPGTSAHQYGCAIDFVFSVDGKWTWKGEWERFGRLVRNVGLTWGGNFKSFFDGPHVQDWQFSVRRARKGDLPRWFGPHLNLEEFLEWAEWIWGELYGRRPSLYLAQRSLRHLNYYHGALDGLWGPQSASALNKFHNWREGLSRSEFFSNTDIRPLLEATVTR